MKRSAALVRLPSRNRQACRHARCVACDILYFTLRDTRPFQLLYHGFWCTMVGQILLGTQILKRLVLFHAFHDFVYGVLSHLGFLLPNT